MCLKYSGKLIKCSVRIKKDTTICKPIRITLSTGRGIKSINGTIFSMTTSLEVVETILASPEPGTVYNARTKTLQEKDKYAHGAENILRIFILIRNPT